MADDCLLFCQAIMPANSASRQSLKHQDNNVTNKKQSYFLEYVREDEVCNLMAVWNVQSVQQRERYLGFHLFLDVLDLWSIFEAQEGLELIAKMEGETSITDR